MLLLIFCCAPVVIRVDYQLTFSANLIPGIVFQCVDQKLMNIDARGVSVFLTGV